MIAQELEQKINEIKDQLRRAKIEPYRMSKETSNLIDVALKIMLIEEIRSLNDSVKNIGLIHGIGPL